MKKLMFAAAAMAACFCSEAVESQVVGYANSSLIEGSKAVGINFVGINKTPETMMLSDVTVTGYTVAEIGDEFLGAINAMKLDQNGATVEDEDGNAILWQWVDWIEEDEDGNPVRKTGWSTDWGIINQFCEDLGEVIPDVPLALNEGVWVNCDTEDLQMVFPSVFDISK